MISRFTEFQFFSYFIDFTNKFMYNLWAMLNLYKEKRSGGGSCEKNISTEQKKTPENSWIQSQNGYCWRT